MIINFIKSFITVSFLLFLVFAITSNKNVFAQTCGGSGTHSYTDYHCIAPSQPGDNYTCDPYTVNQSYSCTVLADGTCGGCAYQDRQCSSSTTGCNIYQPSVYNDNNCVPGAMTYTSCGGGGGGITCHDCAYYGATCGSVTNNCGQTLSCGSCSGYTCSGCNQQNYACSNNRCVAQAPGTPSSNCNSACSGTTVCVGCMLTNTSCNGSGQCVANSAQGQTASSACNSNCGTFSCPGGGTGHQTCNAAGNCVNNSITCPDPCTKPDGSACTGQCQPAACNGTTCQTQGWYCSNATTCSCGWAGGNTVAGTCPGNCPGTATPAPTPGGGTCN